jgi:hypothetical protein
VSSLDVDHAGIAAAHDFRRECAGEFSGPNGTRRREKNKKRRIAMSRFHNNFSLTKASLSLMLLLFVSAAALDAQENTFGDSSTPLVYNVENTGANYATPVFPSFGQLPIIRPLPDPFRFADGTRDTSFASWERRRNEIKAAIEKYEIGPKPDCSDCTITASYTPPAAGSMRGKLTVVVTRNGKSLTLSSAVYIPQGMGSGPFPVLIPMTFFSFGSAGNYGSLPSSVFSSLPIATVDFVHNNVTAYTFSFSAHSADPFYQLYPELCAGQCTGVSNSGQYAAWAWGVSRLIDGMEIATHQAVNPLPIDMKHLAVTGCSYAGKMALFAGAFDERIGLTIAQENGGGGAPSWRVTDEIEADHASEDIQHTSYEWFAGQMKQFASPNVYKLPTDHHELMAMVAPRALLETGNTDFYWLSNRSNYVSARATQKIYDTFGIGDRFGFYIDSGHNHCATLPAEAPAIAGYVDKFMLGVATANTDVKVNPYPTLDYRRWTWWWGKEDRDRSRGDDDRTWWRGSVDAEFPNDWNPGDGTVVLSMTRPIDIDSGGTVLAGYDLSMPDGHPAATVSLAGGSVQTDVSCADGSSYTLAIPLPNQSYSILANDDSWLPSPNHKSPLVYQGSATAAASCSGGFAKSAYFSALGAGAAFNSGGPGFRTTDTTDTLNVRFHCSGSDNGAGGSWSPTITVNYNPQ